VRYPTYQAVNAKTKNINRALDACSDTHERASGRIVAQGTPTPLQVSQICVVVYIKVDGVGCIRFPGDMVAIDRLDPEMLAKASPADCYSAKSPLIRLSAMARLTAGASPLA